MIGFKVKTSRLRESKNNCSVAFEREVLVQSDLNFPAKAKSWGKLGCDWLTLSRDQKEAFSLADEKPTEELERKNKNGRIRTEE